MSSLRERFEALPAVEKIAMAVTSTPTAFDMWMMTFVIVYFGLGKPIPWYLWIVPVWEFILSQRKIHKKLST